MRRKILVKVYGKTKLPLVINSEPLYIQKSMKVKKVKKKVTQSPSVSKSGRLLC